jgi:predicted Ser/Thr protein kinase
LRPATTDEQDRTPQARQDGTSADDPSFADESVRRLRDIFVRACDIPADERATFVRDACGSDHRLAAEVQQLLQHHDGEVMVDRPPMRSAPFVDREGVGPDAAEELRPKCIGEFRIVRELGRGSMGVVYLAEQDSPKRLVALKILRQDSPSKPTLDRFRREIDLLADLHHPGIARVYATGVIQTMFGPRPYFTMEYVAGKPITEYCKENGFATPECLALFREVCGAIQHAHQKGIIHRDLKPTNILVESKADGHRACVVDFGIARSLGSDRADSLTTAPGTPLGTPGYMSPEQYAGNPREIDTRSDIYGLAAVLYELLTDKLSVDVQAPLTDTQVQQGRPQDVVPLAERDSSYAGDLNTIVMKALAWDKSQRYATVDAFAEDLRRFAAREPIEARPQNVRYLASLYARRHPRRVAFAAGAALVACAAVLVLLYAFRETRAAYRELRQRDAIVRENVTTLVERVTKFDPIPGALGFQRDLLEQAQLQVAPLLEREQSDSRLLKLQAEIPLRVSVIDVQERKIDHAEALRQRSLRFHERLLNEHPNDEDLRDRFAWNLILVGDIEGERSRGDWASADRLYRRALAIHTELRDRHPDNREFERKVAWGCLRIGAVAAHRHQVHDADVFLERFLAMADSLLALDGRDEAILRGRVNAHGHLAEIASWIYDEEGLRAEAATILALARELALLWPDNRLSQETLAGALINAAAVAWRDCDYEAHATLVEEAHTIAHRLCDAEPRRNRNDRILRGTELHLFRSRFVRSGASGSLLAEAQSAVDDAYQHWQAAPTDRECPSLVTELAYLLIAAYQHIGDPQCASHESGRLLQAFVDAIDSTPEAPWLRSHYASILIDPPLPEAAAPAEALAIYRECLADESEPSLHTWLTVARAARRIGDEVHLTTALERIAEALPPEVSCTPFEMVTRAEEFARKESNAALSTALTYSLPSRATVERSTE